MASGEAAGFHSPLDDVLSCAAYPLTPGGVAVRCLPPTPTPSPRLPRYADYIGMNLEEDSELLWIADEALQAHS